MKQILLASLAILVLTSAAQAQENAAPDTGARESPAPDPGDIPPAPGLATPNEIIADVDRGLALLRKGRDDEAYAIFDRVNAITYENSDYPPLANHYPNLGLAFYNYEKGNWAEVLRFAASVATGLTADGFPDHPYRVQSSALQGAALRQLDRTQEAEVVLRNVLTAARGRAELTGVYGLALYHLGIVVTDLDRKDQSEIVSEFLNSWSSDWLVSMEQALILNYRDIVHDREIDADLARAIRRTRNLVQTTESAEGIPPRRLAGFRGYLGVLLAQDGDFDTAIDYIQKEYDYYREAGITGIDLNECIIWLGLVLRYGRDPAAGYDFYRDEIQLARQSGTDPHYIARFLTQMAAIAEDRGDTDDAQRLYREAYAEVRSVDRANHWVAQNAGRKIDLTHPGMKDYAFASELGAIDAVKFDLAPDGADVVRLFFEGNYLALDAVLDRFETEGRADTVAYLVNRALHLAILGTYAESLELLEQARSRARTAAQTSAASGNDGDIPADAIIFDLIDAIARVWGTGHESETAQPALDRLRARLPGMSASERSVYRALLAFKHFRLNHLAAMNDELRVWFDDYDADRPAGIWDIFAVTLIMEMSFGNMDEELNQALYADTMKVLAGYPTLSLARDYLRLVRVLNSKDGLLGDEALVELGTLVSSIGAAVPRDHSMLAATFFGMANAHGWRGNREESLHWLRRTAEVLRLSPYSRDDVDAFLLARQSRLLREMGRVDEAHSLAQEALQSIDPLTARTDLIGEIYTNTALALWDRTNNHRKVVAFIDSVLDDPAISERLMPYDRVTLNRVKADAQASYAELPEILATLDRAEAAMDDSQIDWRTERSHIYWSRAIANYWNDAPAEGFAAIVASNDLYIEWLDSIRASAGAQGVERDGYRNRADWEALIGWDYAQTLPPDPR